MKTMQGWEWKRSRLWKCLGISAAILRAAICPVSGSQPLPTISLVSEVCSIRPGEPFHVGLAIHHAPGYHTYWKYPGVVGAATSIEWNLPPGFQAGPIEWPEPERVLMFQIKCQGFERDVILPVKITPPADLAPGRSIRIEGRAAWLYCTQVCHPGTSAVAVELPVRNAAPVPDPEWGPKFKAERYRFPRSSPVWSAAATEKEKIVTLTLSPVAPSARRLSDEAEAGKLIFFTEDGWIDSDKPQIVKLGADGSLVITLTRAEVYLGKEPPANLSGIVWNPAGWLSGETLRSLRVSPALRR